MKESNYAAFLSNMIYMTNENLIRPAAWSSSSIFLDEQNLIGFAEGVFDFFSRDQLLRTEAAWDSPRNPGFVNPYYAAGS